MKEDRLSIKDRETLLKVARQALINGVNGIHSEYVNPSDYSDELREYGATFVTLTKDGLLRGCIGSLEPYQSLVEDVWEHVVAAATQDFRFPPVKSDELEMIKIEISRLTKLQPLIYKNSNELQSKLRPGIDGVVIKDGDRRATFLPQVWDKIKEPEEFLNHLCMKMGVPADTWRTRKIEVLRYQVEEFHE